MQNMHVPQSAAGDAAHAFDANQEPDLYKYACA